MGIARDIVKRAAQDRILDVLAALRLDAKPRGGYVLVCNPARGERNPSLQIWTKPGFEGAWKDHGTKLKGDVFDLVAHINGWDAGHDKGFAKALDWLCATLGLDNRTAPQVDQAALDRLRADQLAKQQEGDANNRRSALGIWLDAKSPAGTVTEIYLRDVRGIDLAKFKRPPSAVKHEDSVWHRETGLRLPCMTTLMQDPDGKPRAVHRRFLAPDGSAKAGDFYGWPKEYRSSFKIWPNFTGAVMPLARGQSDLPVKEACEHGIADTLVIGEGVEDGLSIAVSDPTVRVWAAGSLSNLANVTVPSCAEDILVCCDNDWGKPQAAAQLDRALRHLKTFGKPVIPMRSSIGKDFNDLIRGEA